MLWTGTLSKFKLLFSLSVVGVAEHFRNRDGILQGSSEPPDELPATASEHWQVRLIYTKNLMKPETDYFIMIVAWQDSGSIRFCTLPQQRNLGSVPHFLLHVNEYFVITLLYPSCLFLQTEQLRCGSDSGQPWGDQHLPADARPIAGGVHQVSPSPHTLPHCSSILTISK